jgi:hypothetical protein
MVGLIISAFSCRLMAVPPVLVHPSLSNSLSAFYQSVDVPVDCQASQLSIFLHRQAPYQKLGVGMHVNSAKSTVCVCFVIFVSVERLTDNAGLNVYVPRFCLCANNEKHQNIIILFTWKQSKSWEVQGKYKMNKCHNSTKSNSNNTITVKISSLTLDHSYTVTITLKVLE